jgi:hypothetical protein
MIFRRCGQSVMSLLKDQTLLYSTYHSSLGFWKSCVQISHKWLVTLTDIVWAFYCKLSYNCFLPYNKIWIFVSWNIWFMRYSVSWNFMHVSTKHREIPLTFPISENITSPIQFPKEFHDIIHINDLFSQNLEQFLVFRPCSNSVHHFLWEAVMYLSQEFTQKFVHKRSNSSTHKSSRHKGCLP